jgi:threonine dehydratase
MQTLQIPTVDDIRHAARRIAGRIVRTPLLTSPELNRICGGRVLIKPEAHQVTGSFKIRGALNRIMQLTPDERKAGVVAWSSGNHAQGVAAAAGMFAIPATIVMPADAPALKLANTRRHGATVVLYDRATQDREVIARGIAAERGCVLIPSYDDPDIIAGQGTLGLECVEQAQDLGLSIDKVVVPVSGGGLIAGIALAVHATHPDAQIYAAEPEGYDDHRRSIAAQQRVTNASKANALCDALLAPMPGELTWEINRTHLAGGYALTDRDVCAAMAFALTSLKIAIEPGGAVALAAVLNRAHEAVGQTTVVVLSGGNVDPGTFMKCLETAPQG